MWDDLQSVLLYGNDIPSKLGQITSLGIIKNGTGTERGTLRVLGSYALAYFLEGTGEYCDANGYRHKIVAGDMVLVTPELPHRYATKPGRYWTECNVHFDGPIFGFCRSLGVIDPSRPIRHLEPIEPWLSHMRSLVTAPHSRSPVEKAAEVSRLLAFLMEAYSSDTDAEQEPDMASWLSAATGLLETNLDADVAPRTVARSLGVPYETFRKGFQKQFGVSPFHYRTQRRIAVACRLLKTTTMTHQCIAEYLGYSDEFHFSKRFKQLMGVSPRDYRRQGGERISE